MCMVGCRSLATREASSILKFGSRVTLQERDRARFQFMQAGGLLAAHFEIGPFAASRHAVLACQAICPELLCRIGGSRRKKHWRD